jgi:hypothetical protein
MLNSSFPVNSYNPWQNLEIFDLYFETKKNEIKKYIGGSIKTAKIKITKVINKKSFTFFL